MPYAAPESLEKAISLLNANSGARVLAGGQALLVEPGRSRVAGALLVDLRRIPDLAGIKKADGGIRIGAMTTLSDVAADVAIRASHAVFADLAAATSDAQFRNRATVGGSLADTSPVNPFPAVAALFGGTVLVTGTKGQRTVPAEAFMSGSPLAAGEIILALTLSAVPARTGVAYEAHTNPATLAPICAVGATLTLGADGAVSASRVVLVGGSKGPVRLDAVEKALAQTRGGDAHMAAVSAGDAASMASDLFASADYRKHLARVLTERALKHAREGAGG